MAASPQPWLVRQLGVIIPDASPALRDEYTRRAGLAAAYREAAGITNPHQAVSLEPHRGNPELENIRKAVFTALEIRDEAEILRGLHRGELEARVLAGERALASAPPDVSGTLRVTAQAEPDALRQSADAEVQHDQTGAASAKTLARQMAAASTRPPSTPGKPGRHSAHPSRTRHPHLSRMPGRPRRPTRQLSLRLRSRSKTTGRRGWAELLARADQAARRLAAQQAERQASSEYAVRIEPEAQAQPEASRQAEARDQAEIEM